MQRPAAHRDGTVGLSLEQAEAAVGVAVSSDDGIEKTRVLTPNMKRRGVLRVLKDALREASKEHGVRVTGLFGFVTREDGSVSLLSAVTHDEMRVIVRAVPSGIAKVTSELVKGKEKEQ